MDLSRVWAPEVPGGWVWLTGPHLAVLAELAPTDHRLPHLHAAVTSDRFDVALVVLGRDGGPPSCAAGLTWGGGVRVVVAGDGYAGALADGQAQQVSPRSPQGWADVLISEADEIQLRVTTTMTPGAPEPAAEPVVPVPPTPDAGPAGQRMAPDSGVLEPSAPVDFATAAVPLRPVSGWVPEGPPRFPELGPELTLEQCLATRDPIEPDEPEDLGDRERRLAHLDAQVDAGGVSVVEYWRRLAAINAGTAEPAPRLVQARPDRAETPESASAPEAPIRASTRISIRAFPHPPGRSPFDPPG